MARVLRCRACDRVYSSPPERAGKLFCSRCCEWEEYAEDGGDLPEVAIALLTLGIATCARSVCIAHPSAMAYQQQHGYDLIRLGVDFATDAQAEVGSVMLCKNGWIDSGGVKWSALQDGGHRVFDRKAGN